MPDLKQFRLPDVGEGLTEAEIVTWKVKPGDTVAVNDTIVEIETAKSLVELPSPYAGVVADLLVPEGQTVDVGTPIISVDTDPTVPSPPAEGAVEPGLIGGPAPGGRTSVLVGYGPRTTQAKRRPRKSTATTSEPSAEVVHEAVSSYADAPTAPEQLLSPEHAPPALPGAENQPAGAADADAPTPTPPNQSTASGHPTGLAAPDVPAAPAGSVLAKPPVRKLAKSLGLDLGTVPPSGPGGTVTRDDVHAAMARLQQPTGPAPAEPLPSVQPPPLAGTLPSARPVGLGTDGGAQRETRVPIRGVRKMTAQAMVASAFTAPHVTEWVSVDVTRSLKLIERLKKRREFEGIRLGPLVLVMKALLVAIRRNPEINASWDEAASEIVLKHYVNLGIAAATPRGLVVPNIKDAGSRTLPELARSLTELVATAREGKTSPQDMQGGTITITNVGVFGVDSGTPILNPGESAILAFGAVRDTPWVVKGKVKPRKVTQLALSFDHRLVDGELGSRVLSDVARALEDPDLLLLWS